MSNKMASDSIYRCICALLCVLYIFAQEQITEYDGIQYNIHTPLRQSKLHLDTFQETYFFICLTL